MFALLLLQAFLYHQLIVTTDAVYNINLPSEVINDGRLRGFRDAIDKDFVFGGLFPVHSGIDCRNLRQQRGLERLEAMLFAIDRINNNTSLLPGLTIGYDVRDTCSEETIGIDEALDMIVRSGSLTVDSQMQCVQAGNSSTRLSGIVGAAASSVSTPTATLLGLRLFQSPLVSYASSSAALSNKNLYEYFLRTIPPDSFQANAMVDLVSYFGWEYVSVIFNDNTYGEPGTDAFIDGAIRQGICIDYRRGIVQSEVSGPEVFNKAIKETVKGLLNSTASVVVAFTDESTIVAIFEELQRRNHGRQFVWIASDAWANSAKVRDRFSETARGTFGFQPHTEHVEEFTDYFSQLTPSTNIRDPFFPEYYASYCNENGTDCPNGVTSNPSYSQGNIVPLIIDAVYVFAHAIQDFLNNNCDSPLRWNRATQQCDGMINELNGENLLDYIFNVTFNGIQNRNVSFDENGDPRSGVYEIVHLQKTENGVGEYVPVGFWDSLNTEGALQLNNAIQFESISSRCSESCSEGMIRSITNPSCPSCFECIPCVGPTYSMDSTANNCSLCGDNHWGNNPLSGSTHCVPVRVTHLDFSSGWSIAAMCIASVALIILATITVIFVIYWQTPVVKSSGREQMIMLLIGIGTCYVLTYIVVAPPSTVLCVIRRIGVWFCFCLAFGALLVKIVRVARIFYSIRSSTKRPPLTDSKHQIMFTMIIVAGQLIVVAIGLIVDHPGVKREPEVVVTSSVRQSGDAPEIVETCQESHAAILVLSLVYNFFIIIGCTILGWTTRRFPGNFNEARHVMFTSFTLMVVWVLFIPLYFSTEDEFQTGVLALGVVLSAVALMIGIFFPKIFIIIFQSHKNNKEYASRQNHAVVSSSQSSFSLVNRSKTCKSLVTSIYDCCVLIDSIRSQSRRQSGRLPTVNQRITTSNDSGIAPAMHSENNEKAAENGSASHDSHVITAPIENNEKPRLNENTNDQVIVTMPTESNKDNGEH